MSEAIIDDGGVASPVRAAMGSRVRAKLARNPMISRIDAPGLDIYGRHDFMSAEECARMRAMIDADAKPSTLFSDGANPEYRTSHSCNFSPWDEFVSTISLRITNMIGIDPVHGETLQGQRYTQGQEYKVHCDFFPPKANYWPRMFRTGGQRCWTAMIYLSNVDDGGETHFPMCEFAIPPREGMILIWNNMDEAGAPNQQSLHAALPVTSGVKYVVTKWFRERPWAPGNA